MFLHLHVDTFKSVLGYSNAKWRLASDLLVPILSSSIKMIIWLIINLWQCNMQLYECIEGDNSRLTPPSSMDPRLLSAVLNLQQRSSLSERNFNSPAVAMAPTKEPCGLDNLAFDVSKIYLREINTPVQYLAIFRRLYFIVNARNKLQREKTAFTLCGSELFSSVVPLQMDEDIKDGLKGKKEQPHGSSCASAEEKNKLAYCVTDVPPWYLCIVLSIQVCPLWMSGEFPGCCLCFRKTSVWWWLLEGSRCLDISCLNALNCCSSPIQHYMTAFGGIFSIPLILSDSLCLQHDGLTQSRLINTIFFVSGICTMLQVTFGVRSGKRR